MPTTRLPPRSIVPGTAWWRIASGRTSTCATPGPRRTGPSTRSALFTGFWLSHVPRPRLAEFLAISRAWLRPGGTLALIDSLRDPASGTRDRAEPPAPDLALRRLVDGRTFTIPKVFYEPDELAAAMGAAGFGDVTLATTGRFFLLASGRAWPAE